MAVLIGRAFAAITARADASIWGSISRSAGINSENVSCRGMGPDSPVEGSFPAVGILFRAVFLETVRPIQYRKLK